MDWFLATRPTSRSPVLVNPTTEGVVRAPSALAITLGSPPSMMAMQELVVPKSMPNTLLVAIVLLLNFIVANRQVNLQYFPHWLSTVSCRLSTAFIVFRHFHHRGPQHPLVKGIPALQLLHHRLVRKLVRFLLEHHLVEPGVELLPHRLDLGDPVFFQNGLELPQGQFHSLFQA